jgi:amino acid transporter
MAISFLFVITIYHMVSNRWANYINQTLAAIKMVTYLIIAIAGIIKLANPDNQLNWKKPLEGNTDITAYSTSILLVNTVYENICPFFLWIF